MTPIDYGWRRFWSVPTASVAITQDGYLDDPEQRWLGVSPNPAAVPFEGIASVPCLVLLGEPGMGKSRELADSAAAQRATGDPVLDFHLRDYQTDTALRDDIFYHPDFLAWSTGSSSLTLYLDGLDEGLLSIRQLATFLPSRLRRHPIERLRLRIACRTAEWPNVLEEALREIWGGEQVSVMELLPLRRDDVLAAARAEGITVAEEFLAEIARQGLGPLAAKPVTLNLLISFFNRHGGFPATQAELYRRGCELLCTEIDPARRAARLTGTLTSRQRLAVAARIAAVTIFGGRAAVWTAPEMGDVPDSDVTLSSFTGGQEWADNAAFDVGDSTIREVLGTGLFSSRGRDRLGWAHQTYAEFLAAWYLVTNGVSEEQILTLLLHSDGRIVPQLHEVAARVASLTPALFHALMSADPLVLLRADIANTTPQDRADFVATLLSAFDAGTIFDRDWGLRQYYRKLKHPELAAQLRPYIVGPTRSLVARCVATDIAEACACQEVQGELADVALDEIESIPIRANAALAVARIGDRDTRVRLDPLAVNMIVDDVEDELKGAALIAVWPDHLSAEALFAAIAGPRNETLFGNYQAFLSRHVAIGIAPKDLPLALRWVEQHPSRHGEQFAFRRLSDDIVDRAWHYLDAPDVLPAFAALARARLLEYEPIAGDRTDHPFRQALASEDAKRRSILEMVLRSLDNPDQDYTQLIHSETPLARDIDFEWLVDRLHAASTDDERHRWSTLVAGVFYAYPWTVARINIVLEVADKFSTLATKLEWVLTTVKLSSPEATRQKESYEIQQGRGRRERLLLKPSPKERIAVLLDRCEQETQMLGGFSTAI